MSISSTTNRVSYSGDGSTTTFSFPHPIQSSSDLKVYLVVTATEVKTLQTLTTHYTISGTAVNGVYPSGVTVTFLSAPANTKKVVIIRDVALSQGLDLVENDILSAESLEQAIDKRTLAEQRLADRVSRAVALDDGVTATFDPTLPLLAASNAGATLALNGSGTAFTWGATTTDISSAVTYASNAATSASAASTSATNAASSAAAAASSASAAATSETNSATSASSASTSAATATTQAAAASSSASSASTSASTATTQAAAAASSASSASTSASTATTQAATATTQAAAASSSASAAAASAAAAATSATNAAAAEAAAANYAASLTSTSVTSLTVGTGSKTFTTQSGKSYAAGMYVLAASAANTANYMHGQVTSYSGTSLVVNVQDIGGSGTLADWNISISGSQGATGATGATGPTGSVPIAAAGGTVDAITADYTPDLTLTDKVTCMVVAAGANTSTTPTFAPDGLTAHTITKAGGAALIAGDIPGAGYVALLEYNSAGTRWELLNPGYGVFTGKTGSGSVVLASSPTLVTPALGTPASGVLTNCTGLPSGSIIHAYAAKTTTYSILSTDRFINVDASSGSFTVTLPTAVGFTGFVTITRTDNTMANTVSIATTSAQTVNGYASSAVKLHTINESYSLYSDGANWRIAHHYCATPRTSYTPSGAWSTNTTFTGFWQRDKDCLEGFVHVALSGAPTSASLDVNLPASTTIDTAKLTTQTATVFPLLGDLQVFDTSASQTYSGNVVYSTTTAVRCRANEANVSQASPMTFATGDSITIRFKVPISGWIE